MKILKYYRKLYCEIGTPELPKTQPYLQESTIYANSNNYAAQMAQATAEAYNGEVTVEDVPDEPREPTQEEQLRADVDFLAVMTGVML